MREWTEVIECPACEASQVATITQDDEWPIYVHECEKCGQLITESEWNTIGEVFDGELIQPGDYHLYGE